jgi:hypothetical protein
MLFSQRTCTGVVRAVVLCSLFVLPVPLWSNVFIRWSDSRLPAPEVLGFGDLVVSWNEGAVALLQTASRKKYRVYAEASVEQATAAAEEGAKNKWAGIILRVPQRERDAANSALRRLRSTYPGLVFAVVTPDGKEPEMRGSLVIKRESVLEVSSPTAQPWIDSNLAVVRIEQRVDPKQVPMYEFQINTGNDQKAAEQSASDYLLPVAEAGAFHAELILEVDPALQKALGNQDAGAWKLWKQVRAYASFYSEQGDQLEPAANVAVVVDDLDTGDEAINLLARHNIPFQVLLPSDLQSADIEAVEVFAVFAKPDKQASDRLAEVAGRGKTVVVIDAHGSYPWQKGQPVPLNEHATSYAVGSGKVIELSEPVSDPETFSQDIRRLLGKQNTLLSLWNGLTTIAVPYRQKRGAIKVVELINYAQEPVRVQVQVKGTFTSVRYESPQSGCCTALQPVTHDGFTEFVVPDLMIAGRVHLE